MKGVFLMRKIINKIISNMKNEEYELDKNIPTSYLISLCFQKMFELIRGFFVRIHFAKKKKGKRVFVGKHVTIKCKNNIKCGKCVSIGDYTYINALCKKGIELGSNISIGRNSIIECTGVIKEIGEGLKIEDGVGIASNAFISVRGNVLIKKNTIIGPYVKIFSENHIFNNPEKLIKEQGTSRKGIIIGENCWIGSNVTILDGVIIGDGAIIAAGAIVNKNVKDNEVVGGVPAKLIKNRMDIRNER